jgi:hypothetical protein
LRPTNPAQRPPPHRGRRLSDRSASQPDTDHARTTHLPSWPSRANKRQRRRRRRRAARLAVPPAARCRWLPRSRSDGPRWAGPASGTAPARRAWTRVCDGRCARERASLREGQVYYDMKRRPANRDRRACNLSTVSWTPKLLARRPASRRLAPRRPHRHHAHRQPCLHHRPPTPTAQPASPPKSRRQRRRRRRPARRPLLQPLLLSWTWPTCVRWRGRACPTRPARCVRLRGR